METSGVTVNGKQLKDIYYFITYSVCFVSLGLGMASLGTMLPFLAEHINVDFARVSFLFSARSLGYLIGSAGGGRLYDRLNGHKIMILSLGLMIVMSFLTPLIPMIYLLMLVMFIFGLGEGALDIGGNVNLLWVFQSRVGPYMNALHFAFGVGAFLSPIIVYNMMNLAGGALTWPFWTLALLFLPGLVGLIWLKAPTNPEKETADQEKRRIDTRLIILMMILFFIYVGVEGGFGGWIFSYALEENIATESAASYMNSIFWGALTLGRLISVPLSRKLKPSQLLIGNFSLAILFLGLILVLPINPSAVWIGSAGLGLALSSIFPTLLALGETRLKVTGSVTGLFFLGSSLAGTVVPMLLGQIFEYIGTYQVMLALFGLACLGFIVLISVIFASNKMGEKTRTA